MPILATVKETQSAAATWKEAKNEEKQINDKAGYKRSIDILSYCVGFEIPKLRRKIG